MSLFLIIFKLFIICIVLFVPILIFTLINEFTDTRYYDKIDKIIRIAAVINSIIATISLTILGITFIILR